MALTMADANKALAAAIKSAEDVNIKLCVAVCDVGGRLIAFNRMDGAGWASIYGAQGKALASAATGAPSGSLPADHPVMIRIVELEGGNMVLGQGGVPIIRGGVVEGAVGAGGGTGQQDEDCSAAGAAAIS
jgi:glc operon protein GlcG